MFFILRKKIYWLKFLLYFKKCYFFTVEFGLCRQSGELRAYGAGLLSSIAELKHALSDKAKQIKFDPNVVVKQECLITTFQESYFYSESFNEAKQKMRYKSNTRIHSLNKTNAFIKLIYAFKRVCIENQTTIRGEIQPVQSDHWDT